MNDIQHHILLAEDDLDLGHVLKLFLEMNGMKTTWVKDGDEAISTFDREHVDLCILDVSMPKRNGFEVAAYINKKLPNLPFMFLTAKAQKHDRLEGLKLGAVDYITKPFEADELVLRVQNILRQGPPVDASKNQKITIGIFELDLINLKLLGQDHQQQLTARETQLLHLLIFRKNVLIPKEEILEAIWGSSDYFTGRSMDVFISRLRKYLSKDPNVEIERVRGEGIRLVE